MADYIRAIQAGISAARRAELARSEVASVLDEVSKQLSQATNGRLRLAITEEEKTVGERSESNRMRSINPSFSAFKASMMFGGGEIEKVKYRALSIVCTEPKTRVVLCRWDEAQDGYPVKLQYAKKEVTCRDRRSLEQGIEDLLGDSTSGAEIERLLSKADIEIPSSAQTLDMSGDVDDF